MELSENATRILGTYDELSAIGSIEMMAEATDVTKSCGINGSAISYGLGALLLMLS
jgi:hypothetical protein